MIQKPKDRTWPPRRSVRVCHILSRKETVVRDCFCGWYLKCQNDTQTVALIPAWHRTGGKGSCSLQIITDDGSWNVTFPFGEFRTEGDAVGIGKNRFSRDGITLDLHTPQCSAKGSLTFGPFAPIRYDIMGPFRFVPFLECRHSVLSMKHTVNGTLEINGVRYEFREGMGYMEGDRGSSFPKEYVWTQCCFPEGAIMLSAADISLCGLRFTGVISAIHHQGREYRMGTYLGARAVRIGDGEVIVRQGRRQLTVRRLEQKGFPLAAPVGGDMTRTIHETAACRVYYHYQEKGKTIFEFTAPNASFEYEYPQ